jgi:hypothetical protein
VIVKTSVIIGKDFTTGEPVHLDADGRLLSTYTIGATGTGKTTLLENIALQDMKNGHGLCYIDPAGDSADRLLDLIPPERERDVIFWDVADFERPFGLAPFEGDPDNPLALTVIPQNFLMALESLDEFRDVFALGNRMRDTILKLGHAFVANPGHSLLDAMKFLDSDAKAVAYRKQFYEKLRKYNSPIYEEWDRFDHLEKREKVERAEPPLNKLRRFAIDPVMQGIFGQTSNSIDFRFLIDDGKILIVQLADIGHYNAAFIGAFIVSGIWSAAQSRTKEQIAKAPPFHLIADEFQDYMTKTFEDMQRKVRKYGVDTIVAHQERGTLGEEMKSTTLSVRNKIVFGISGKDAEEMAREYRRVVPEGDRRLRYTPSLVGRPLDHIEQNGSDNPDVVKIATYIRGSLDELFRWIAEVSQNITENSTKYVPDPILIGRAASPQEISALKVDLERRINRYLYECMRIGDSVEKEVDERKQTFIIKSNAGQLRRQLYDMSAAFERVRERCLSVWDSCIDVSMRTRRNKRLIDENTVFLDNAPELYALFGDAEDASGAADYMLNEMAAWDGDEISQPYIDKFLLEGLAVPSLTGRSSKRPLAELVISEDPNEELPFLSPIEWAGKIRAYFAGSDEEMVEEVLFAIENILHFEQFGPLLTVSVYLLGLCLLGEPIVVLQGKLEEVAERPRTYADVKDERASNLLDLPLHTAICRLIQKKVSVEYKIRTIPLPDSTDEGIRRGEEIKEYSRTTYGRERPDLDSQDPTGDKGDLPKNPPPPPDKPDRPKDDDYDDDGAI